MDILRNRTYYSGDALKCATAIVTIPRCKDSCFQRLLKCIRTASLSHLSKNCNRMSCHLLLTRFDYQCLRMLQHVRWRSIYPTRPTERSLTSQSRHSQDAQHSAGQENNTIAQSCRVREKRRISCVNQNAKPT